MILDKASLEVALDYCRDYRIDGDYVYLERVKQLLDPLTSHNDYQVQVNTILPLISNAAELSSQVKMTCLPKMSSYDYERKNLFIGLNCIYGVYRPTIFIFASCNVGAP